MTKKQKKMLIRIIIAAVMLAALHFIPVTGWLRLALYLVTYVVIGYDIMKKAGQGILNGRVFDENFLMAVATIGAFALAIYEKKERLRRTGVTAGTAKRFQVLRTEAASAVSAMKAM